MLEFLFFLFCIMVLALIPAYIASSKGRSFVNWWLYGCLLLIAALPHAVLIPDQGSRKCPYCAELVKVEAIICKHCGRTLTREANKTICAYPECGKTIPVASAFCIFCGQRQQT